jgi:hypothetical protein
MQSYISRKEALTCSDFRLADRIVEMKVSCEPEDACNAWVRCEYPRMSIFEVKLLSDTPRDVGNQRGNAK